MTYSTTNVQKSDIHLSPVFCTIFYTNSLPQHYNIFVMQKKFVQHFFYLYILLKLKLKILQYLDITILN